MQILVVLYLTNLIGWTSVDGSNITTRVEGIADKTSPGPDGLNNVTNQQYDGIDEKTSTNLQSRYADNYRLPYVGEIRFPMYSGKEIVIEGIIQGNAKDFTVRLCQSDWCDSSLPFEMCVDLQDKTLVSSSTFNGQKKQFDEYTDLPLIKGYAFVLVIIITDSEFQIVINEKVFATYPNHLTFDAFKYVQVFGNVDINWILFSIINPVSPVKIERRPGGEKIVVYGYPTNDTTEFSVNVHCLPDCDEAGNFNIVTHVNPRFNHLGILKRVVVNHFINGIWAFENVFDEFNFRLGYQFKLQLLTNQGSTLILIDNYFRKTWYHGMNCYNSLGFYREVKVEKILMS